MAEKIWNKGNISFMPVVESINRKFALRREVSGKKQVGKKTIGGFKFMGAGTRTQFVAGAGNVSKNYFWMRKYGRSTSPSADEIAARLKFGECSQWVSAARKDLSVVSHNNQIWRQLRDDLTLTCYGISAEGYNIVGFMFAYCYKYYTTNGNVPSSHQLPALD